MPRSTENDGDDPEPGGDAAERLRQHLDERFGADDEVRPPMPSDPEETDPESMADDDVGGDDDTCPPPP